MISSNFILRIINLSVSIKPNKQILKKINLSCSRQEFIVIIGKNGQGKTTLSLSITNLLNKNHFNLTGQILFNGSDILSLTEKDLNLIRQKKIGYILQNPFSSFNPIKKIKTQFEELSKLKNIPFDSFIVLMKKLNFEDHDLILKKYPFELSGGILQRLSAVRCLASKPSLIIADEPTSALDRPVVNQLLNIFYDYVQNDKGTLILITQDISTAEKFADKIAFLNNGELKIFDNRESFFYHNENLELYNILESYKQLKV